MHIVNRRRNEPAEAFLELLGHGNVETDTSQVAKKVSNTLGVVRPVCGILYPRCQDDVRNIVLIANRLKVSLYPISRGKNIGYGEKTPAGNGQWVVDFVDMNSIRDFDPIEGHITVEPGVTQGDLYKYLKNVGAKFWPDSTGAGSSASIVGNVLEGGFGHTPKGNRRRNIVEVEAVLGNGTAFRTGTFPGVGPDLSGIFVQSNFGVITAVRIELLPKPEHFESFFVQIRDEKDLGPLIDAIRKLRQQGVLTSVVHVGNSVRTFLCGREIPKEFEDRPLLSEDAIRLLSSPMVSVGPWGASGALYGYKCEIKARKKVIVRELGSFGKVRFWSDRKLETAISFLNSRFAKTFSLLSSLGESLTSYKHLHDLLKGVPTDEPVRHIHGRIRNPADLGLLWIAPVVRATGPEVMKLIQISRTVFEKYGYDFPVTLSFVEPALLVGILNVTFDKSVPAEVKRAHEAYQMLSKAFKAEGMTSYRTGLLGMSEINYGSGKTEVLSALKGVLDPQGVIAPGRYNIRSE